MLLHPHSFCFEEDGEDITYYERLCEYDNIFEAIDTLSFNKEIPGYGAFKYNKNLVLTKEGETRSHWALPDFFKDVDITYHNKDSFKKNYFQSAGRGQEFIIDADEKIIEWAKNIIKSGLDK